MQLVQEFGRGPSNTGFGDVGDTAARCGARCRIAAFSPALSHNFLQIPGFLNGKAHGCGDGVDYFSNASYKCCSTGEDFNAIHAIIRRTFSLSLQLIIVRRMQERVYRGGSQENL